MNHAQRTSPCLAICTLEASAAICQGCGRTLDEIRKWAQVSDAERERILLELPARLAKLPSPTQKAR